MLLYISIYFCSLGIELEGGRGQIEYAICGFDSAEQKYNQNQSSTCFPVEEGSDTPAGGERSENHGFPRSEIPSGPTFKNMNISIHVKYLLQDL